MGSSPNNMSREGFSEAGWLEAFAPNSGTDPSTHLKLHVITCEWCTSVFVGRQKADALAQFEAHRDEMQCQQARKKRVRDHDHRPVQHRDGKSPWCRECGLTLSGCVPTRTTALESVEGDEPGMMGSVTKTPVTNFRIPADIKAAAQAKAESEGKTLTRVVVDLLREYARPDHKESK